MQNADEIAVSVPGAYDLSRGEIKGNLSNCRDVARRAAQLSFKNLWFKVSDIVEGCSLFRESLAACLSVREGYCTSQATNTNSMELQRRFSKSVEFGPWSSERSEPSKRLSTSEKQPPDFARGQCCHDVRGVVVEVGREGDVSGYAFTRIHSRHTFRFSSRCVDDKVGILRIRTWICPRASPEASQ